MADFAEQNLVRGMAFLAERQAAIANNLANVDTGSYKRRIGMAQPTASPFQSMLDEQATTIRYQERQDWTRGIVRQTDNPFDVSLDFDATGRPRWMKVQGTGGQEMYTRNGQMQVDNTGRLTNMQGLPVLSTDGAPIQLPTGAEAPTGISILPNGQLKDSTTGAVLGQIGVFELDPSSLRPAGNSLYVDTQKQRATAAGAGVQQGALEGSNVDSLQELVQMIAVERSFSATQKALSGVGRMHDNVIANILR